MNIEFDASMTEDDFLTGELFHKEADKKRFMAMSVALTRNSDQLKEAMEKDAESFLDLLSCGIAAHDHFENVMDLLSGSVVRLAYMAELHSDTEEGNAVLDRAREIANSRNLLLDD